jgi:peptidoglycan/xylan/chitin deacetylase (PgdA/CDA1 family)
MNWRRGILVLLAVGFLVPGCTRPVRPTEAPPVLPTLPPTLPSPAPSLTATPLSLTATPSPTAAPTPTVPPSGDIAPVLPHLPEVQFIYHGDRTKPYVALTFDVCQKPEYPAWFDRALVEVLLRYDVPATFFLGGDWMRTHPEETRLLAQNPKFELGNHSWSHPDLPDLNEAQLTGEIVKTQDLLYQLTGRTAHLFRLPSGLFNDLTLSVLAWNGLYTIQWDVETGDPDPNIGAERMNRAVRERVQNGSIIIMHANGRGWHTAEALPAMIENLKSQGYTLVTVSQLIGLEPVK